jgi:sporulation protein YtfJ
LPVLKHLHKNAEKGESMEQHPIENIMKTTMENIKDMIDVNTIVGDAVETSDGTVIIPISRVSFGFVAGGGEYKEENGNNRGKESESTEKDFPFAGGTGAGVSVNPMAFLVVGNDHVKLLPVHFNSPYERVVEMVPQVLNTVKTMLDKGKDEQKRETLKKTEAENQ